MPQEPLHFLVTLDEASRAAFDRLCEQWSCRSIAEVFEACLTMHGAHTQREVAQRAAVEVRVQHTHDLAPPMLDFSPGCTLLCRRCGAIIVLPSMVDPRTAEEELVKYWNAECPRKPQNATQREVLARLKSREKEQTAPKNKKKAARAG